MNISKQQTQNTNTLTALLALLAATGPLMWHIDAEINQGWYAVMMFLPLLAIPAMLTVRQPPRALAVLAALVVGASLAGWLHDDNSLVNWLPAVGLSIAMIYMMRHAGPDDTIRALAGAGLVWLVIAWPLQEAGTFSRNIMIWPYVFGLAAVAAGGWRWALVYGLAALMVNSRGVMVGLAVGLLVLAWEHIPARLRWPGLIAAALLPVGLFFLRPDTAMIRLSYVEWAAHAIAVWPCGWGLGGPIQHGLITLWQWSLTPDGAPMFALGPVVFPHAHNIIIDLALMLGIQGLAATVLAVVWTVRGAQYPRWVLAILAATLAHGMFDSALWYPWLLPVALGLLALDGRA